jgi:superfamily I DNA/RNA helicase
MQPDFCRLAPDANWPRPRPEYVAQQQRAASEARLAAEVAARRRTEQLDRDREVAREIEAATFRQLELDFGAAIEAADDAALLSLLPTNVRPLAERECQRIGREWRSRPLFRPALLRALAAKKGAL